VAVDVRIDVDEQLVGMIQPMSITSAKAETLLVNEGISITFERASGSHHAIGFRCLWNPLQLNRKPFPIGLIKANSGSGNEVIASLITATLQALRNIGSVAHTIAFDGDRSDLSLLNARFHHLLRRISNELHLPLHVLITGFDGILRVEDPLHIIETDRYLPECADLTWASATLGRDAFASLGMSDGVHVPGS
jgi:hypothetical protein